MTERKYHSTIDAAFEEADISVLCAIGHHLQKGWFVFTRGQTPEQVAATVGTLEFLVLMPSTQAKPVAMTRLAIEVWLGVVGRRLNKLVNDNLRFGKERDQ